MSYSEMREILDRKVERAQQTIEAYRANVAPVALPQIDSDTGTRDTSRVSFAQFWE